MSTGLMEQESHAFHVAAATGVVVVAGLGMAMYVHAVAAKQSVEHVIVVEQSAAVIDLMRDAVAWDTWPSRGKLLILQADALDPELGPHIDDAAHGRRPDYLFADIWPRCASPQAPGETAAMVRALRPQAAGWWGQELAFAASPQGAEAESDDPAAARATLDAYFAELGVPVPVSAGYATFCRDVAAANATKSKAGVQTRAKTTGAKTRASSLSGAWRRLFGPSRR